MEKDTQIFLESMITGRVVIDQPELRLKRVWERKGAKKPITWGNLQEIFYDPGVEYMIRQGMLYIDSKEARIELGLEAEEKDTKKSEVKKVVKLDDTYAKRLMGAMPFIEFKTAIKELTYEQLEALVQYAIQNECLDLDKCELLKELTQYDIVKAVQLERQAKEA